MDRVPFGAGRTLGDLERVAPALLPHRSATVRPIDWELLQSDLGVALPTDYREYAERYPPLFFDDFLVIRVPEPGNERGYVSGVASLNEEIACLSEDEMTEDYTLHPDEGGLICCGGSNRGDYVFWRRNGPDPDRWPAVVYDGHGDWWEHEGGLLALVVGLIDGSVDHRGMGPTLGSNPAIDLLGPPTAQE